MRQGWLGSAVLGWLLATGCGGSSVGGSSVGATAGTGGQQQNDSHNSASGTNPSSSMPQPNPPAAGGGPGICLLACMPRATFVFNSKLSASELRSGVLKACRKTTQDCRTDVVPPVDGANTIAFGRKDWEEGPGAFSVDEWATINFSWSDTTFGTSFHDGERFSLTFIGQGQEVSLVDQVVKFEDQMTCAGPCRFALYDSTGDVTDIGGAPTVGEAGAFSAAGWASGVAGEGGAPNL